jgi:hypothetical protein
MSQISKNVVYIFMEINILEISFVILLPGCEPGSSVSIVTGYWVDDREIGVRSPAEPKGFFL